MTRYLVTGASGLLGWNTALHLSQNHPTFGVVNQHPLENPPFQVVTLDMTQNNAVEDLVEKIQPEVIIHCAALANLEACERNPDLAHLLNALVPHRLAKLSHAKGIKLVHISTDAVFDGQKGNYTESDAPNPINIYARSKLAAERAVSLADPNAIIARVNFYGRSLSGQRSLSEWFINNLAAGKPIKGFTDVYFCPLFVGDLIETILEMVAKQLRGLYHVVSSECLNKYDFGCRLARQFGLDETLISPVSWKDGGLVAVRSPNLTLCCDKLTRDLGHALPQQDEGIQRFHSQFLNKGV